MEYFYQLLATYGYAVILPVAIIEGPIIAVIAGYLASQHILNISLVYVVVLAGDVIGDMLHYWLGRYGRKHMIPRIGSWFGVTEDQLVARERHFDRAHIWKTMFFGKFAHAPNSVILVAAGAARVDQRKFLLVTTVATAPKAALFVLIGYFFGQSYREIGAYINDFGLAVVTLLIVFAGVYYWYKMRGKHHG